MPKKKIPNEEKTLYDNYQIKEHFEELKNLVNDEVLNKEIELLLYRKSRRASVRARHKMLKIVRIAQYLRLSLLYQRQDNQTNRDI